MRKRKISTIAAVITCVVAWSFQQSALAQNFQPLKPDTGKIQKFERPKTPDPNQGTPSIKQPDLSGLHTVQGTIGVPHQSVFTDQIYDVSFVDNVQGNAFSARLHFPTSGSLRWQYYWDNSPKGPLYPPLKLESNSDHTFTYSGKRNNENNDLEENLFNITFSNDFNSLNGYANIIIYNKSGTANRRFYIMKGQTAN